MQSRKRGGRTAKSSSSSGAKRRSHPEIKGHIDSVIIQDNGCGFTENNYHAFETADTTRKLALGGKGVGRFTWLVAFAEAMIVSRYNAGADRRAFRFTARSGIEDAPEFEPDLRSVKLDRRLHRHQD